MRKRMSRRGSSYLYQREATVRLQRIRELCKGLVNLKAHISDFACFSIISNFGVPSGRIQKDTVADSNAAA